MVLKHLSELKDILVDKPTRRLVLAAAQDQTSLTSVISAARDGYIEPILVGDKEAIQNIASENNLDISGVRMIHEPDTEVAVEIAVKMVRSNQADILMKGKVGTSTLLKAVLNKEWGLRTGAHTTSS
jgi:phosphate butyryltransferase